MSKNEKYFRHYFKFHFVIVLSEYAPSLMGMCLNFLMLFCLSSVVSCNERYLVITVVYVQNR